MKKIIYLIIIVVVFVGVVLWLNNKNEEVNVSGITTFEKCAAAGNPIMESFPEQCRTTDGVHFVNWRGAGQFCIQVITQAKNPETGETREFPTPCDVPANWEPVQL